MIGLQQIILTFLFPLTLLVMLIEVFFWATWNRFYFGAGLLIFKRQIGAAPRSRDLPAVEKLAIACRSTLWGQIVFRALAPNAYGFREKFLQLGAYTPIMHGLLLFDYDHRRVVVKGYANWATVAFMFVWFVALIGADPLIASLFSLAFVLVVSMLYMIQFHRFGKVGMDAARFWSA